MEDLGNSLAVRRFYSFDEDARNDVGRTGTSLQSEGSHKTFAING